MVNNNEKQHKSPISFRGHLSINKIVDDYTDTVNMTVSDLFCIRLID